MRLLVALLALSIGSVPPLRAQDSSVRGIVFADANGNGVRDRGERGLPGVVVSNQDAVVTTDSSGAFGIAAGTSGIVFLSVPDGYRAVGSFWRSTSDPVASRDFALRPVPRVSEFTFVHASDTHIAPAVVQRTRRFRALVDSLHPAFALIAGDLVRDAMSQPESLATSYYDLFVAEARQFTTPLWTVPGNHENFGIIRSRWNIPRTHRLYGRGMYRHYLGPDYYSFTWGGVHFVGLNSVSMDDSAYYGYVDSVQMAWLERDLSQIPRTMPVVTFNHIPLVSAFESLIGYVDLPPVSSVGRINGKLTFRHTVSNVVQVMDMLSDRPYPLALGAHIHAGERLVYEISGRRTRFEQCAAIVGPGQLGTMTFPSGFTLYTVRNGEIDAGRFIPLTMESSATP
jgi:hypothetical protein